MRILQTFLFSFFFLVLSQNSMCQIGKGKPELKNGHTIVSQKKNTKIRSAEKKPKRRIGLFDPGNFKTFVFINPLFAHLHFFQPEKCFSDTADV